jgi:Carboxypeptidase regulatory-like domain
MQRTLKALFLVGFTLVMAAPVHAQITTGTVSGTVADTSGAVIPGASVVLVSESRGTRLTPAVTNANGEFVIAGVTPDTYTIEVSMDGFKTFQRQNMAVSGGDRVAIPPVALELGVRAETVQVRAEATLIQARSGERSAVVDRIQVENLPLATRNFTALVALTPGVSGTNRIGGGGQNNIMMDGISAMDTGNNGQMLQMNIDSIQEVKVLTSGYQAEFGRSSGLQITAVTKSGTNRFHGSAYELRTDTSWNSVTWANQLNGTTPAISKNDTMGYTIGGPVGKPGGENKLFFFYSHEYRPTTSGGGTRRFRFPTDLEMQGDFSQSTNNNGAFINQIYNPASGLAKSQCTGTVGAPINSAACFAGNRIPGSGYTVPGGINILHYYRNALGLRPNIAQDRVIAERLNYNYETTDPVTENLVQQPAIRFDYQLRPNLRVNGKYAGQRQTVQVSPGSIPGFNDTLQKFPFIHNFSATANWTINATTFVEGTWGTIMNYLGAPPITEFSRRANVGLGNFPLLYPDAGAIDPRYYETTVLEKINAPFYDASTGMMNLPPVFLYGSLVANAPPNITFPGFLNINRTNDVSISLTKVWGRHTLKAGYYLNHSYKAQNRGSAAVPGGASSQNAFQGIVSFAQDANNPLDTGFGYANAYLGAFSEYVQSSRFVEGSFIYNNIDWYLQDNWRATSRLTFEYGLRFVHQQPQYDQYLQSSNFFPELWRIQNAPALYAAGCATNTSPCTSRQARNPVTGALLGPGSAFAIGTLVSGANEFGRAGDPINGVVPAGEGINSKYNYVWPTIGYAPRVGAAYDLNGDQRIVIRGSYGLFFDRPNGNTVFNQVGNPPLTQNPSIRYSTLADLSTGIRTAGASSLNVFEYNAKLAKSHQWNTGVQLALPWSSSLDLSYVGQHQTDALQEIDINAVNFGSAFEPAAQDPTQAAVVNGSTAVENLIRPYRGFGAITQNTGFQWNDFHSIQTSFNRRFQRGMSLGANYTYTISQTQSVAPRLEHVLEADGSVTYRTRADQAQAQDLLGDTGPVKHQLRANFVYDPPNLAGSTGWRRVVGAVANDWQLSGVLTASSGTPYNLGFSYNTAGSNINITGSPQYGARAVLLSDDLGSGCSSDRFSQFNNAVVALPGGGLASPVVRAPSGPATVPANKAVGGAAYSDGPSLGLESGTNYLTGCASRILDLALARNFRLPGGRSIQIRLDVFNVFDTVVFTGRNTTLSLNSPTDPSMREPQFNADGSPNPARLRPQDAGFGAATAAAPLRSLQAQVRFQF